MQDIPRADDFGKEILWEAPVPPSAIAPIVIGARFS
jgi:hypothetical protein